MSLRRLIALGIRKNEMALTRNAFVAGALLLAAVVQGLPVVTAGASASAPRRIQLGHENVITGEGPAMVRVKLAEPATISNLLKPRRKDIAVTGRGPLVGFALVQETPSWDGISLVGGRLPRRSGLGNFYFSPSGLDNAAPTVTLPAGDYRLYLLAGRRPVEVSFLLNGPSGRVRLAPRAPVRYEVATPEARLVDGANNVYGSGADGTLSSTGMLFDFLWVKHSAHANTQYQFCLYEGGERGAAPYSPGCPALDDEENVVVGDGVVGAGEYTSFFYGGAVPFAPNRYGQGFAMESAAAVEEVGYLGMWLSLD